MRYQFLPHVEENRSDAAHSVTCPTGLLNLFVIKIREMPILQDGHPTKTGVSAGRSANIRDSDSRFRFLKGL